MAVKAVKKDLDKGDGALGLLEGVGALGPEKIRRTNGFNMDSHLWQAIHFLVSPTDSAPKP